MFFSSYFMRVRVVSSVTIILLLLGMMTARVDLQTQAAPLAAHDWLPSTPPHWPVVLQTQKTSRQVVAHGVETYSETFNTVEGPEYASMLDVDLSSKNIRLGVVQANEQLLNPGEAVSSMANRTHALAGINGDFFEMKGSGDPINMEMINGQLIQSPGDYAILGVKKNGQVTMNHETFSGMITTGSANHVLTSINRYDGARHDGLTLITPMLGDMTVTNDTVVLLQPAQDSTSAQPHYMVQAIKTDLTKLNKLTKDTQALVGGGTAAIWLSTNLHVGDTITLTQQISPDNDLVQAIGGGPILLKDGRFYTDPQAPNPGDTNVQNPLTAVGIMQDGKQAIFVTFDGRKAGITQSRGLTRPQMAGYLLSLGAYQAMVFDGGGSTEMVARLPGREKVSVLNTPSDGHERLVANSLFVYSTETQSGSEALLAG
ncbi:hypothetical protein KDA_04580 [Dictyobacter alpinus]|uniref:Phosphodiester glycosidase domain-containing protein n=1 Tax=Dictyobacter alpinus TaxID=2014873 RepID=A0A402B0U5_9CHLR|nr:phosphodiester glycosidase family protein [Dictyobacter alpinus]GCE24974.1 hypothetical protein KDA_04580 [Dictyobacter alpinus]